MWTHRRLLPLGAVLACLLAAGVTPAQNRNASGLPAPRVLQVFPTGARAGSTVEVTVAGRHLEDAERLAFSHPGIKAELIAAPKAEVDPKAKAKKPRAMAAAATDVHRFRVTVPADVPLGAVDVRLVNKWGVSNPRVFLIGDQNEIVEKEPNNDVEQAERVALNTVIHGTIATPTDVDYFVFKAVKGQRVVVSCLATSVDSRLQPAVEVFDGKDRQLAGNRNYAGNDAVTDFVAPADGDYFVRVFQFTHTFGQPIPGNMPPGTTDHFYRLNVSTAPWIDAVYPPVVEPGKTTSVTVFGRNLPGGKPDPAAVTDDGVLEKVTVPVTAPAEGGGKLTFSGTVPPPTAWTDGFDLRLKNDAGSSNPFLIGLASHPVVLDAGNNDTPETAQPVTLPCEIAGHVERRRDRDWYSFTAKKGETWGIEVLSNRLGAPTYMMLALRNPATKGIVYESPLNESMQLYTPEFFTRSEDPPAYRFTAPADGTYQLLVASRAGDTLFGVRHTYVVRITRGESDYRLVALTATDATPDTPTVPPGGQDALTILAHRPEGFTEDIELTVEGLPPGVSCPPQVLGGNVSKTTLVLSAQPGAAAWAGEVRVKGTATVNGTKVVREARPAGVVWPVQPGQNTPTLSRLDRSLWLAVRGKAPFTLTPSIDKPELLQGDKATLKLVASRLLPEMKNPIQVSLMQSQNRSGSEIPNNLRFNNNQPLNLNAGQAELTVPVAVGTDVPPGVYNVVFRGQTQVPYSKDATAKTKPNTIVVAPSLPVQVTILPKTLATVSTSGSANVKIGGESEVRVQVQRKFNYAGEYRVRLVVPAGVKGIESAEAVVPPGQTEVRLTIKAPVGTAPGNRGGLIVRATSSFRGKSIVDEARLSVNVVK
ncbi:MAG: PPC domain-containing protein [Gemmataceae bacterium]